MESTLLKQTVTVNSSQGFNLTTPANFVDQSSSDLLWDIIYGLNVYAIPVISLVGLVGNTMSFSGLRLHATYAAHDVEHLPGLSSRGQQLFPPLHLRGLLCRGRRPRCRQERLVSHDCVHDLRVRISSGLDGGQLHLWALGGCLHAFEAASPVHAQTSHDDNGLPDGFRCRLL